MKPILFTDAVFDAAPDSNGIGVLSDAVSCVVTEELNGDYSLKMTYPLTGAWYKDIGLRSLIVAKPNKDDRPQPFRVYRITRTIDGKATIYARHISSDFSGIPVTPFAASDVPDRVLRTISDFANLIIPHKFILSQDVGETTGTMEIDTPRSAMSCIIGSQNSFVDVFGGELKYDRYSIHITKKRGEDTGVRISFGKNMTALNSDADTTSMYTGIYPYAVNNNGTEDAEVVILRDDGFVVRSEDAEGLGFERIKVVDLTEKFVSADGNSRIVTKELLLAEAQKYLEENAIVSPKHNIKVSFVPLADTIEYAGMEMLEGVSLGDTVTVVHHDLGIETKARCIKTEFDSLLEKYKKVEIGDPVDSIIDTIASLVHKTQRL